MGSTLLSLEEKKERQRRWVKEKRLRAKNKGICRDCPEPTVPGLTRCEKHQADHLAYCKHRTKAGKQVENESTRKPTAQM